MVGHCLPLQSKNDCFAFEQQDFCLTLTLREQTIPAPERRDHPAMKRSKHDSSEVVVVTGDVTMDWNIARIRRGDHPRSSWNADDVTRAYWQRGGAALLADLIQAIAHQLQSNEEAGFRILQTSAPTNPVLPRDDRYHHSYALWSAFDYETKLTERRQQVWRVAEFMGLDRSKEDFAIADWKEVKDDTAAAPIVVLDDADLGFRGSSALWPKAILSGKPWIILKMARPIAEGDLWQHLQKNHPERLIVVMAVDDLRLSEVQISRGLSWERTAQDIVWELVHNPRVNGLSRCAHVVISFDTAGAIVLSRSRQTDANQVQAGVPQSRLYFDPAIIEGMWKARYPGALIGYTSCLAAGIVTQVMLNRESLDIGEAVRRGLAAMRKLHREGYGKPGESATDSGPTFPFETIAADLATTASVEHGDFVDVEVRDPMRFIVGQAAPDSTSGGSGFWTILGDRYTSSLASVAQQIALDGPEVALEGVPLGQFGGLLTVDRQEIESFRSIRSLVGEYAGAHRASRPLNIAVFGAPGSGKSFGIAEVAKSLLGKDEIRKLTFNLSQFNDPDQLHDALHQVRDVGLSGMMPLVFWDEFDTSLNQQELGWLAHFLAPMQDGAFQQGQITHAIGRAIFVFAGGTKETMEGFDRGPDDLEFRNAKGPDFVSRLKGYVNILGPNPRGGEQATDPYYIIRRAILLRSILHRDARHLFRKSDSGELLNIDSGVLRALLFTRNYKHGVRSIESVIAMSELSGKQRFERSCLPAASQLDLHVDALGFQSLVQQIQLEGELLERLAEAAHEAFCDGLRVRGYRLAPETSDRKKTHRFLLSYSQLPEEEKEQNRGNVRDIPAKLASVGYLMIPARSNEPPFNFPGADLETLAEMEHERWTKEKIRTGYRWGPKTDPKKKLHKDLLPWRKLTTAEKAARYTPLEAAALDRGVLPEKEKEKDRDLVRGIPRILARAGFTIVPLELPRTAKQSANKQTAPAQRNGRSQQEKTSGASRPAKRGRAKGAGAS
jgi:hypothetical protein